MNYVRTDLIDKGMAKLGSFAAAESKKRHVYILTPQGIARKSAMTNPFLARRVAEYEALKMEIQAVELETKDKRKLVYRVRLLSELVTPYTANLSPNRSKGTNYESSTTTQAQPYINYWRDGFLRQNYAARSIGRWNRRSTNSKP
tara:strand:- start:57 stop:491 length:435 start_codon:yes stop_codon:yes gene_type:complete